MGYHFLKSHHCFIPGDHMLPKSVFSYIKAYPELDFCTVAGILALF